ncbi:MAG: hypothetical protein V4857_07850 [Pseudomonadota bacterium]
MPGRSGATRPENQDAGERQGSPGNEQLAEPAGGEDAEIQQSVQREGMGNHRHSNRGNEQAIDATDAEDLGSHEGAAADAEVRKKPG